MTKEKKKNLLIVLGLISAIIVALISVIMISLARERYQDSITNAPPTVDNPEEKPEEITEDIIPKKYNEIAFKRESSSSSYEMWIYDFESDSARKTTIDNVDGVYSNRESRWIVVVQNPEIDSTPIAFRIYDKETDQIVRSIPIPEDDEVMASVSSNNSIVISPDGNKLVYKMFYYSREGCYEMCPEVDPYPKFKNGYYSYDIENDNSVFLGEFILISNWDLDSNHVYVSGGDKYHEYDLTGGLHKIDVNTGASTLEVPSSTFDTRSEFFLSVNKSNYDGTYLYTDADSSPSYSSMNLLKEGKKKVLSEKGFADIQPHTFLSPDHSHAIYFDIHNYIDGRRYQKPILIDIQNQTIRETVVPELQRDSVRNVLWISDNEFVYTLSSDNDPDNYEDNTSDLFKMNIDTNEIVRLTEFEDCYLN
jgi:hypothetical protein